MKRKYLTGAAILLFIALGVSYYYRSNLSANVPATDLAANAQTISAPPHIEDASDPKSVTGTTLAQPGKGAAQPRQIDQKDQIDQQDNVYNGSKSQCAPRKHHRVAARRKPTCEVAKPVCENIPVFTPDVITETAHTTPLVLNVAVTQEHAGYYPQQTVRHAVNSRMEHEVHYSNFSIGIEGGLNENSFYSNRTNNIMTTGFHAGIITNFDVSDNFAIQPSLRYMRKGNKVENEIDVNHRESISLHYVELPLNFVYKFGHPDNARFMMGAGPYIAYLAGKEAHFSNGDDANDLPNPPAPLYPTANILTWDWGAGGFLGVTTPEGLFVKAGTQVGLVNLVKNPVTAHYDYNRNLNIFVTAGYLFGGHHK